MPWKKDGDGLILDGSPHFNKEDVQKLIKKLRVEGKKNGSQTVCNQLDDALESGKISKKLILRFSKWCQWPDPSQYTAQEIAKTLFYGIVCRRLLDIDNKPIPDRATANVDYDIWRDSVVKAGHQKSS